MFRFRELLLQHADDIALTITRENGKTLTKVRAELQRGIENVEVLWHSNPDAGLQPGRCVPHPKRGCTDAGQPRAEMRFFGSGR